MSYLTLSEAAEYTSCKTGLQIEPAAMLRAGVHGVLLIAAPFSSLMRNLTAGKNDEVLGLLVVPPKYLLKIETDGQAKIIGAVSLDGKTGYSPQVTRTRDQLRVLVSELDRLMPYWVTTQQTAQATDTAPEQSPATPAPVAVVASVVIHSTKARRDTLTPVIELAQNQGRNPLDTAEVWAALLVLAENKHAPLRGATEDGLQYLKGGEAANFTRKSLGQRLAR